MFYYNPNNPTGTYLNINEIKMLGTITCSCLLIIDPAYSEFVTQTNYSDLNFIRKKKKGYYSHSYFFKNIWIIFTQIGLGLLSKYSNGSRKIRPLLM